MSEEPIIGRRAWPYRTTIDTKLGRYYLRHHRDGQVEMDRPTRRHRPLVAPNEEMALALIAAEVRELEPSE